MNPRADYDSFFLPHLLFTVGEGGNGQHVARITGVGLAQSFSSEPVSGLRIFLEVVEIPLQV